MSSTVTAGPRIHAFADPSALAEAVAQAVSAAVRQGLELRGCARLVFSGGTTPEAFLPRVAQLELPWHDVEITLADERWVDEDSPHSNAALLRRALLAYRGPSRARFTPLKTPFAAAADGIAAARKRLPPENEPYDLVLLGMGNDGHFASIFPHAPRTRELLSPGNTERVTAVPAPATSPPAVERITMTLAELRRSTSLLLVLQSQRKREVLAAAYAGGDALAAPVVALGDVDVFWSA